jgi:hypothetical protein
MPDRGLTLSSDNEDFLLKQGGLCPQRERLFLLKREDFSQRRDFPLSKEEIDFLCLDTTFRQSLFEIQTLK